MKNTSLVAALALLFSLFLAVGCSKRIIDAPPSGQSSDTLSDGANFNYPPAGYSEEGLPTEGTLDDARSNKPAMTDPAISPNMGRTSPGMQPIYFLFDQATIPADMNQILVQNAEFLKANPTPYVIVEGNCDERGSKEYNMALGERRSLNVRNFLVDMGIQSDRIRTVSYGEERPIDPQNNENAWSKNRRVDFVLE